MTISQHGAGPALVLVPGIQGRWEYMRPTVETLARFFRVLTFSLRREPGSGLENDVAQIVAVLGEHHIDRAIVCGVSFGGLVAMRFAAAHAERTSALVLASVPGPGWRPQPRHQAYARVPWLFGPLFLAETPFRLRREIVAAFPHPIDRWRFVWRQARTVATAPLSLARMAERARLMSTLDVAADCRRITAPTLVVTGDPALDHVVPVDGTSEYARLIRSARHVVLDRTGHLGTITRPEEFAGVVKAFVDATARRDSGPEDPYDDPRSAGLQACHARRNGIT